MSRGLAPRSAIAVIVLATAVAVNIVQFTSIERAIAPTWQAVSVAREGDLIAVARAGDDVGVEIERQFSVAFALREHAPGAAVLVYEPVAIDGVLMPELVVGIGGARCVVARSGTAADFAVEDPLPIIAEGIATTAEVPFVLARGPADPDVMLVLDQRDEAGRLLLLDAALVPENRRPESPC